MKTFGRLPICKSRVSQQPTERAFTLIELLTVISIIAILSAITFGVVKGVNDRAAIAQAKAELASLAQALESYKMQYGDYPQFAVPPGTGSPASSALATTSDANIVYSAQGILFNALMGKRGPLPPGTYTLNGAPITVKSINGKPFVDLSKFTLLYTADDTYKHIPDSTTTTMVSNAFMDPWGHSYYYAYKAADNATLTPANQWTSPSYVLMSDGPDGYACTTQESGKRNTLAIANNGTITSTSTDAKAVDNIYANH